MSKNILITGRIDKQAEALLVKEGFKLHQVGARDLIDPTDHVKALEGMDGYILGGDEIVTESVINQTQNLKVISFLGVGYHTFIDATAAKSKSIIVTNTPGANKQAVAEMSIAFLLAASRKIPFLDQAIREGKWLSNQSSDLKGKTLGIIGMGEIGAVVAKIAHLGFGMKIVYNSRTKKKEKVEKEVKASFLSINKLCEKSDFISIHCAYEPKNPKTANTINAENIALMKPTAVIINTARPEIVNGHALYNALVENKIAAAAFDGYYTEPHTPTSENDEYKLLELSRDKFIITPHTAWSSKESDTNMCILAAQSVIDILNDKPNNFIVNN